jgi:ubiquinone/menaquinone biosynthesis C-methylase UbiE
VKRTGTSVYDATASSFERYRSLPTSVVESIRSAIKSPTHLPDQARVLDLGAGTGRIGKAFLAAGDFYIGVDSSLGMLQEFSGKLEFRESKTSLLAQAEGSRLPFKNAVFDLVLLMQVLNSANWRPMLDECRRVLRPGGIIAVGHTKSPESGVDAQLKRQLAVILEGMRIPWHQPREWRRQALAWLEDVSVRHWSRHRTGAKFAALPPAVQQESLAKLRAWAETNFGSVNAGFEEHHSFALSIFEF